MARAMPVPPCLSPRDSCDGQKADWFGRCWKLHCRAGVVTASTNYIPVEKRIGERNVISARDDSDQAVQRPSRTTCMEYTEDSRAQHTCCRGPVDAAVGTGQHPTGDVIRSPRLLREQALSKSTKGTGFAKQEIISKPCLSHISHCVEDGAGQRKGITGIS